MGDDVRREDLGELDWDEGQRAASLTRAFEHAVGAAKDSEAWYARKRPSKRAWGRFLRLAALVLGAAAALVPIISELTAESGEEPAVAPGWSTVALVLAAALISLDRFFGFSGAWMRFMATEMRLTRLRRDFEYAWNERLAQAAAPPTLDDVDELLALARGLVTDVDREVANETATWVEDFRGHLERTEQSLRAPTAAS